MNTAADSIEILGITKLRGAAHYRSGRTRSGAKTKRSSLKLVHGWEGQHLHLLRALQQNGVGHLWGVEADRSTYDEMLKNIRTAAPETLHRFTPLFGFSQRIIPPWLAERGPTSKSILLLDGGNNPSEQIIRVWLDRSTHASRRNFDGA